MLRVTCFLTPPPPSSREALLDRLFGQVPRNPKVPLSLLDGLSYDFRQRIQLHSTRVAFYKRLDFWVLTPRRAGKTSAVENTALQVAHEAHNRLVTQLTDELECRLPVSKLGSPDHECAMLPPCRRRGSTYRNRNPKPKSKAPGKGGFVGVVVQLGLRWGASVPTRTRERRLVTEIKIFVICLTKIVSGAPASTLQKPPPQSPNRGHLAKGGSWVSWGSWGCVGVLQFRPERASGVWLLKSKFSLSALRKSSAARLLQRYRNRISGSQTAPPSPNRGHLAKEGPWVPWGSWGCVGVLRFRPERASGVWLLKIKFSLSALKIS